jgi:hypothetical protein
MNVAADWHEETLRHLRDLLAAEPAVVALAVVGSGAWGGFDSWSDVDVLVVVRPEALDRFFPGLAWLRPLGRVYAVEQHPGELSSVTRLCFEDLRRLDLIVTTDAALVGPAAGPGLPLADGHRLLFSRSAAVESALAVPAPPPLPHVSDEAFDALATGFWFKGVVAVQKVVRGDLLVALHLSLELVQECCVLAMMLRDRETGTTRHRGGVGDRAALDLEATRRPHTAPGILDAIEHSATAFDRLGTRWSLAYQERRDPLLAWVEAARRALAAPDRP